MELEDFPERNVEIAKNQPEYKTIPAYSFRDPETRIAFVWKLTIRERIRVLLTGRIWHQVLTFGRPLQPQLVTVEKPEGMTLPEKESSPTSTSSPRSAA